MYEELDERKWIKKEDGSHSFHLRTKYKGLWYIDPDAMKAYVIQDIIWYDGNNSEDKAKYYCVCSQQKNNDSKWDLMPIDPDLCLQIQICDQDNNILLINGAEKYDCMKEIR